VRVLVVNAGSSSLKLSLLDDADAILEQATLDAQHGQAEEAAAREVLRSWPDPDAVGHRIVHGGTRYTRPVSIDEDVRTGLDELTTLAPLHQPKSLAALDLVSELLPIVPAVACFDTAFHSTLPQAAATYAVPAAWRQRGVRRYGFHGLSVAWAWRRATELAGPGTVHSAVVCHLGAGCSVTAVVAGRSVDTTMGFTPLEGLVMATRSGTVDPGLVLWLQEQEGLPASNVAAALERESGLLALAGTADVREVVARAEAGDPAATLAREVFVHRIVTAVGAMAAAAGGAGALVFTGGVGEHSAPIRKAVTNRLAHLGLFLDVGRNARAIGDADLTAAASSGRVFVVTAREDREIAAGVRAALRR
jgi:acetate kinase